MNRPWWLIPLILGFVGGWLFVGPPRAHSHEWFAGKSNPVTGYGCCGGSDCEEINDDAWSIGDGQISVKWRDGQTYSMPASQMMPTEDKAGRAAACVWGKQLKCFFGPLSY